MSKNPYIGDNWKDVEKELFTPEEIAESHLKAQLVGELINARDEQGLTQRQLEEISGVKQPVIARIETGKSSPTLDTVMKLLYPLGKKLVIVPIDYEEDKAVKA